MYSHSFAPRYKNKSTGRGHELPQWHSAFRGATGLKILLVDHHPLMQQALHRVLDELSPDLRVLDADSCGHALDLAKSRSDLDLILMVRRRALDARCDSPPRPYGTVELTDRQAQVLALLVQGKPNKIISRELGLAQGTVKIHVTAILRKLKVSNRTQAALVASRLRPAAAPAKTPDHVEARS
jgi:DNA-binding NarL/FixJ family response regulator